MRGLHSYLGVLLLLLRVRVRERGGVWVWDRVRQGAWRGAAGERRPRRERAQRVRAQRWRLGRGWRAWLGGVSVRIGARGVGGLPRDARKAAPPPDRGRSGERAGRRVRRGEALHATDSVAAARGRGREHRGWRERRTSGTLVSRLAGDGSLVWVPESELTDGEEALSAKPSSRLSATSAQPRRALRSPAANPSGFRWGVEPVCSPFQLYIARRT